MPQNALLALLGFQSHGLLQRQQDTLVLQGPMIASLES